jgi:hypothetical protein
MAGQAKIAVRPEHQDLLAFKEHFGVLVGFNGPEIGIQVHFPDLLRVFIRDCFFQQGITCPGHERFTP